MSHEILKAKNEISMVLRGRKSIAPIFFPFLTLGCGQPKEDRRTSLSKHRCDVKVKLGRGSYAISIAILSMHTGFQHPRTKYMLAPGLRKLTFLCGFSCGFAKWSI